MSIGFFIYQYAPLQIALLKQGKLYQIFAGLVDGG
jgi:hypothetical protein